MGCSHEDGDHHNCGYVERRNALIPFAEAMARREFANHLGSPEFLEQYGAYFLRAMTMLSESGLPPEAFAKVGAA